MFVKRMDPAHFEAAYGILVQEVYPWPEAAATPFGAVWAIVEPGRRTKHHNHQEGETFFVTAGRGRYRVGDEVIEVAAGDVVFQPPFHSHLVENTSESENLVFLSIYWEDLNLWNAGQAAALFQGERPQRALVTAAPPEAAAGGGIAAPALAADIVARYLRLRGAEVTWIRGIAGAERSAAGSSEETALRAAGIEPDLFPAAAGPPLAAVAEELFLRLQAGGELLAADGVELCCAACAGEAWLRGRCRRCGAQAAGLACAACGWPTEGNLEAPTCAACGAPPVEQAVRRLVFPLSRHAGALAEIYLGAAMGARQRAFLEELAEAGLPDLAVTRSGGAGLAVPAAGLAGQVLSPWVEGAAGALAAARAGGGALTVDCFGIGDLFLRGIAAPAILHAFDPQLRPAAAFVLCEEAAPAGAGEDGSDAGGVPADLLRFHRAATWPESASDDAADLASTVERELVGIWQPWLAALGAKLGEDCGGAIPSTGDWLEAHRRFYARLQALVAEAAAAYEPRGFAPRQAVGAMGELVRAARRFGLAEVHWQRVAARGEERRTGLALELLAAKALALMAAPVMPGFAARLWRELGFAAPLAEARWEDRPAWLPGGQALRGLGGTYFAATVPAAEVIA